VKAILLSVIALAVIGAIMSHDNSDSNSATTTASSANAAKLHLDKRLSWCVVNPSDARIVFFLAIRNTGPTAGSIDVRPWRRYNDGSTNDSIMDTLTIRVPAHGMKRGHATFDYNALNHDLLECGVYMGNSINPVPLEVVR
jgi:hypothetical protein